MAILGVDDFKAKLRGGGARSNLFKATINFPGYAAGDVELTSFMCKGAQLPQSVIEEVPISFRGRLLKIAGERSFEPWSVTVLNDTDFGTRDAMERWMNGINGHTTNVGLVNPVDYQADLIVEQLDRDDTVLKSYIFRNAYPLTVATIELSNDEATAIETFEVSWRYQHFEPSGVSF